MRKGRKLFMCWLMACLMVFVMAAPISASAAEGSVKTVATADEFKAAANDGSVGTIKVTSDMDLSRAGVFNVSGKTIDLGGHKISAINCTLFFEGENFTIKNGTFDAKGGSYALFIGDAGTTDNVLIEDITLIGGINVFNSMNVVLRNVNANVDKQVSGGNAYYAVWCDENGHVTIESGSFTSSGAAVLGLTANASELKIEGGEFTAVDNDMVLAGVKEEALEIKGGTYNDDVEAYIDTDVYAQLVKKDGKIKVIEDSNESAGEEGAAYKVTVDGVTTYYEAEPANPPADAAVKKLLKVSFAVDGGSEIGEQMIESGNTVAEPQVPTKKGYIFRGWYTDEGFTAEYDMNQPVTGELTLYAKWEKEPDAAATQPDSDKTGGNGSAAGEAGKAAATGDDMNLTLAVALMAIAAAGIAGTSFCGRKKKHSR